MQKKKTVHILLLAISVMAVYAPSINAPFIFDDIPAITENRALTTTDINKLIFIQKNTPVAGRPLPALSLLANYKASGTDTYSYHLFNIIIHAACAIALYLLLYEIFSRTFFPSFRLADNTKIPPETAAFAGAALRALHPLNSEPVCYITQRTESMMTFFYLQTLFWSIKSTGYKEKKQIFTALAAALSFAAGALCKENIITAPLVAFILIHALNPNSFRKTIKQTLH
jgi:hypothetical protein